MNTISKEKLQAKSMFESRFIQNEEVSLTKLISIESNKATQVAKDTQRRAPAPAMYWSCPQIYGDIPPKIRAHASVVLGDKMFVFGGTSKTLCSDTLYVLELGISHTHTHTHRRKYRRLNKLSCVDTFTWYVPMVFGTAPPPCRAHCLCADNTLGKIYLFGGGDGQKYHNHLYILDTSTMNWTRPKTTGEKPSERRAHVTALWKDWLYVFGGGNGTRALNDVYRLNLKTREWESVHPTGIQPISRGYHTGTLVGNKWIIFGGSDGKECFGGIHVLDLETECWFPVQLDPQMPRLSHSAICVGSFLFVFAGHDGAKYCNDLLMLNLVNMTWETKVVYGQAPTPRGYHTTVLYDSRIYLFGGYNGTSFSSDVYILDLSSYAYLPQIMNFEILH
ncbi:uncharacterized protein EV154DRAFT_198474 [Mucor mucedo]|uniref:uncharacterized protein n=1 Tax=Mucor mucedo TaxID=29922 RepID=UPI0022200CEA|nr:uncharacterized protein EV154DRAFT_198474 [Mucor mucedo]KAI7892115.1 hypothetical protein EV154DRAFT_198474 [Mucor mucedo]